MKTENASLPADLRPEAPVCPSPALPAPAPESPTPEAKPENPNPMPPRAWEADPFWREVVRIYTSGKKLRGTHYLETLTAAELAKLRHALSIPGVLTEQQKLCPRRRGGDFDGALPDLALLSRLGTAIRQVTALADASLKIAIETAQAHCQSLGIEPDITNRVLRTVANQVLDQKVNSQAGAAAIANALVRVEEVRGKLQQNEAAIKLRKRAEHRLDERLELDWARHEFNAVKRIMPLLPELQAIQKDKTLNDFEKINEIRLKLFGRIAENEPQP